MRRISALLALLAVMAWPAAAGAHVRSVSYSFWHITQTGGEARARVSQLELTRLGLYPGAADYRRRVTALLTRKLTLHDSGGRCAVDPPAPPAVRDGYVIQHWQVHCRHGPPQFLRTRLLLDVMPAHLHFAQIRRGDGPTRERVLTEAEPNWELHSGSGAGPPSETIGDYFVLGVGHILSGWDHLAFLLALTALAAGLRELALLATGFTAAHSLTLAAAVLGWAHPDTGAVEAFIALSIVLVAVENAWRLDGRRVLLPVLAVAALLALSAAGGRLPAAVTLGMALFTACYFALSASTPAPGRWRLAITFAFGLFHGFGFAGVLSALDLPAERLAPALLGFNLGVEAGQIALLTIAWPLLAVCRRRRLPAPQAATAAAAALGVYWLIARLSV